jgi:rhamnulokinase
VVTDASDLQRLVFGPGVGRFQDTTTGEFLARRAESRAFSQPERGEKFAGFWLRQAQHLHYAGLMEKLYIACDYGWPISRIMLGTLTGQTLRLAELHRFRTPLTETKGSWQWNIQEIFQQTITTLQEFGRDDISLHGISCSSWGGDYVLVDGDGALLSPVNHRLDPNPAESLPDVLREISAATIYEESGCVPRRDGSLFQLRRETSRRLKQAARLLPFADAMNHLLGGQAAAEYSSASTTQLFNPALRAWSRRLANDLRLRPGLLPDLVPGGTKLGPLRKDLAAAAKLDGTQIIASCSYELAAALAGLPPEPGTDWAYLRVGPEVRLGTLGAGPSITATTLQHGYDNEIVFGAATNFSKRLVGLEILDACRAHWLRQDRELSDDILLHLAATSPAFAAFIDPADARFADPVEMPLKIQAYCRETGQEIPRKPGQIIRCVLESLALQYRRAFQELEGLTGRRFNRLHLFGAAENTLLNHFIVNALQIPAVLAPTDAVAIGNIVTQAQTLGHIRSREALQGILQQSFKLQAIIPQPASWDGAAEQMEQLVEAPRAEVAA